MVNYSVQYLPVAGGYFRHSGGLSKEGPEQPCVVYHYIFTSTPALLYTDSSLEEYPLGPTQAPTLIKWTPIAQTESPGRIFQNSTLSV